MLALALMLAMAAPEASPNEAALEAMSRSLPKGWTVRRTGLPAGMLGMASGPEGDRVAVSVLPRAVTRANVSGDEAQAWLYARLGLQGGRVDLGGPMGTIVVSGTRADGRALIAWIFDARRVVTWVGPAARARLAEKQAYTLAERLTKR